MARGSTTRHTIAGLVALCAVLLHALVTGVAPLTFYEARDSLLCAEPRDGREAPADPGHHEHGTCCILACTASGLAFLAVAPTLVDFPQPLRRRIAVSHAYPNGTPSPLRLYFGARGPPHAA